MFHSHAKYSQSCQVFIYHFSFGLKLHQSGAGEGCWKSDLKWVRAYVLVTFWI